MIDRPDRAIGPKLKVPAVLVLVLLVSTGFSEGAASAEIPQENYSIASPDLTTVIDLLNASIRASENALQEFNGQNVSAANQSLDIVSGVLGPAEQILNGTRGVAGSYDNLSYLLPPFGRLCSQMRGFSSMEGRLLTIRDQILAASRGTNLTNASMQAALQMVQTFGSLMATLNGTIDRMLVSAGEINGLTLGTQHPFVPNTLTSLIEKLRDLLSVVRSQVVPTVHNGIPWGSSRPFLLLWLAGSSLYLGETLVGGGYLYYNGSFRGGQSVHVLLDSRSLYNLTTAPDGTFGFSYVTPITISMLGTRTVFATASTPYQELSSDTLKFVVNLMPTNLSVVVDRTLVSPNGTLTATANLTDVYGDHVGNALCTWSMDGASFEATTSTGGTIRHTWPAGQLGLGRHLLGASYAGVLPYASCSSSAVIVTVNIPTTIRLALLSNRFAPGHYLVGNGTLLANDSEPIPNQRIALAIDGHQVVNVTTDSAGSFAFSISSNGLTRGTHKLRAEFLGKGTMWRYSEANASFVIMSITQGAYPFLPFFPGWGGGIPESMPYLFFGPGAFYTWMFMLLVLGAIVMTLRVRKQRVASALASPLATVPLARAEATEEPGPESVTLTDMLASVPSPGGHADPNGRIIWYYNGLLDFLRRRRLVTISDSMTHLEVARLLKSLGYQKDIVEMATSLFERAFYSGTVLSDADVVSMSNATTEMIARKGGATGAG